MNREPVDSSAIQSIGYDAGERALEVQFASGDVYRYDGVPERVHEEFRAAESRGRYFQERVRDAYPYRRVERGG